MNDGRQDMTQGHAGVPRRAAPRWPFVIFGSLMLCAAGAMAFSWWKLSGMSRGPGPGEVITMGEGGLADNAATPAEALATLTIPEFAMVDQDERPQSRAIFEGRWTVLAFTFTRCVTACPIMNSHLLRLQHELSGTPARIVSITVDPEGDTPAQLKKHAQSISADTSRWTFLTGDRAAIESVVRGLKFAIIPSTERTIQIEDGKTMADIAHPTQFIIVGPDVKVRALVSAMQPGAAEQARDTLKRLIAAEPETKR